MITALEIVVTDLQTELTALTATVATLVAGGGGPESDYFYTNSAMMSIPGFAEGVEVTPLALIDPFCVAAGKVMVFKAQITLESP